MLWWNTLHGHHCSSTIAVSSDSCQHQPKGKEKEIDCFQMEIPQMLLSLLSATAFVWEEGRCFAGTEPVRTHFAMQTLSCWELNNHLQSHHGLFLSWFTHTWHEAISGILWPILAFYRQTVLAREQCMLRWAILTQQGVMSRQHWRKNSLARSEQK